LLLEGSRPLEMSTKCLLSVYLCPGQDHFQKVSLKEGKQEAAPLQRSQIECAASRGLVSPMQWARTRRKVLGSTSYLMPKGKGNNSMSVKRKTGENAVAKVGSARPA